VGAPLSTSSSAGDTEMTGLEGVPYLQQIRAPNRGPMTLDGTNTWVITDPAEGALVVDPGPAIESHLATITAACAPRLTTILLTHRHLDHSEGAAVLAEQADCGVRAADRQFRIGRDGLDGGQLIALGALSLEVFETPGHTSDSRSLLLSGPDGVRRLLTGDMVLGRGTTVITHPDGNLEAYLDSLDLLERLVTTRNVVELLPGHGPIVTDPLSWLSFYRRHRHERLDEIRAAIAAGDRTASEIVARVYADVDRSVWPAAEQSVRAQLDYLRQHG
jgi:glyoxylase-like metal-dependent hydrolase (beta-lactamase superfamily II)